MLYTTEYTFTKKVPSYVDESALVSLVESGVLLSYEIKRGDDGSEVTFTFSPTPISGEIPPIKIVSADYYEDNQICGYCSRVPGSPHKSWCRQ
jgi:hypothetical protein